MDNVAVADCFYRCEYEYDKCKTYENRAIWKERHTFQTEMNMNTMKVKDFVSFRMKVVMSRKDTSIIKLI